MDKRELLLTATGSYLEPSTLMTSRPEHITLAGRKKFIITTSAYS